MTALPTGWQQRTLAETCHILAGFGFPERLQGKLSGDFPFYKVGDISETWKRGDTYLTTANHYLDRSEAIEIRARPLPKDTTVFAKIGAAIALNRRAILSVPALVDNNVMGLHPATEDLDPKFLFHFVCTLKLDELSRATTVPSVRKSDIEQIQIPLPPLPEQRQIVAEIEKQFTRLDAGVAALRRTQANLKRYRAAVLKAACEGKLVPTEAELTRARNRKPKFETGDTLLHRLLTERRNNWQGRGSFVDPAAPDASVLPRLPSGWTWATVEQLSNVVRGASPRPAGDPRYFGGNVPWITVGPLTADNSPYLKSVPASLNELGREHSRYIEPQTLLLTNSGATLGVPKITLIGGCINDGVAALLDVGYPLKLYLLYFLRTQTEQLRGLNQGAAQPNLNTTIIKGIPVPLPPLAEQTRIVAEVERRLSVVEELETIVNANLQRATRLRQSILQQAFCGGLAL